MTSVLFPAYVAHVLPSLASVLVASLWQGVALVLLTACMLRLFPEVSAAVRSALWTGVLGLAALLPLVLLTSSPSEMVGHLGTGHLRTGHQAIWHARSILSTGLIAAWVLAAVARFAQLLASAVHLRQVLHRAEPLSLSPEVASVLSDGGLPIRVCASGDVDRPSVAGFLHPRILLPPGLSNLVSEAELRHILLHEREHLRRHDHWVNLLGQISLVLFPLSPALIWVNRRLALEREFACDDRVLQSTGTRKAYVACLARVAESSLAYRNLSLAIGMLGARRRSSDLARRVTRILSAPTPAPTRSAGRVSTQFAAAALCAGILGSATVLARSPELVSFAPASAQSATALARWAPPSRSPSPPLKEASNRGHVVSVLDRVSTSPPAFRSTTVKAVFTRHVPPRDRPMYLHSVGSKSASFGSFDQPRAVLTDWHVNRMTRTRVNQGVRPASEAAAPLRGMPVLLRVSSRDPEDVPTWYPAIQLSNGWIVLMI